MFCRVILCIFIFIVLTSCQVLPPQADYDVVTNYGPQDCRKINLYYEKQRDKNSYFPGCVPKKELDETCGVGKVKVCAPGLECVAENPEQPDDKRCKIDKKSCMKYEWYDLSDNIWKPKCLEDNTYAPVQCKGESENGRCFCFDAFGKRIFGQEWSDRAEDMTCACSRRRSELEREGRKDVTLHCDSLGNYERLQCDSGLCWCAEPKTGKVLVAMVPQSMMTQLPCFNKTEIGENYLRKCESQLWAQAKISEEFNIHGTKNVELPFLICDYDGSYGAYKIQTGNAICTLRDNTPAGSWQANLAEIPETMTCNCAKDTIMYQKMGQTATFVCDGAGSYKKVQTNSRRENYCVDSDGFPTTDPPSKQPIPESECPDY